MDAPQITLCPIILCGGSGTRLWPISTESTPKQFISLGDRGTLLEETLRRVELVSKECRDRGMTVLKPFLIMHAHHVLPAELASFQDRVIYEPEANDTAVAIARAGAHLERLYPYADLRLLVLPADHYIVKVDAFVNDITNGILRVTNTNIVLFGIQATSPETKYGYILNTAEGVVFKEKPNREMAMELLAQAAMWNSGIFVAHRSTVMARLRASRAGIMDWVERPREGKAPSFDVAVLQEYSQIVAHESQDWGWSDVGSFMAFTSIPEVAAEIAETKGVTMAESSEIVVLNRTPIQIAVIGCSHLYVILNEGRLLIMNRASDHDNSLKAVASAMG